MKTFKNLVPRICDNVEYEGEKLKKGSKMIFSWEKPMKMSVSLEVKKIVKEDKECELVYDSFESKPKVPWQEIQWKLIKLDDTNTLIEFRHSFQEEIKKENLDYISRNKKKILISLKKVIEKRVKKRELIIK